MHYFQYPAVTYLVEGPRQLSKSPISKIYSDALSRAYLFSAGGVVLASRDGKIVCENTLDARLDVAFRKKLPQVVASFLLSTHTVSWMLV